MMRIEVFSHRELLLQVDVRIPKPYKGSFYQRAREREERVAGALKKLSNLPGIKGKKYYFVITFPSKMNYLKRFDIDLFYDDKTKAA